MDSGSTTPFTGSSTPTDTPADTPTETDTPPPRSSEVIHFTPRRAMASFENLVALANHQERLREARKIIWRDRGEPVAEVSTLRACLEHAATGGFRKLTG
ncbi:hypothetical protein C0989_002746 [Termitomyces sp. Mn162]|nr:hypothetical protein C0989_002746 [Termitomyces sp. Mn162]